MIVALTIWLIGYLFTLGFMMRDISGDFIGFIIAVIILIIIWPLTLGVFIEQYMQKKL